MLCIGLMSGTSMDGVDAVLAEFEGLRWRVVDFITTAWPEALRADLKFACTPGARVPLAQIGELDVACGQVFAAAVTELLGHAGVAAGTVAAIGSHGQTILHGPSARHPFTMQIGDPNTIAAGTGIVTIADFRRMDIALGGQGAPLAPAFHAYAWRDAGNDRVILNLGGIANLTLLPRNLEHPVRGFDTGPGNGLLDQWAALHLGTRFDDGGRWSATGRCRKELLNTLLADPYFHAPAPKSTGRDYFDIDWLSRHLQQIGDCAPADVQATLVELTAVSVAQAVEISGYAATEMIVCGGGAHNQELVRALAARLPRVAVRSSVQLGLEPDAVEAVAFAWLAARRLLGLPGNLPSVTGARRTGVLGAMYLP